MTRDGWCTGLLERQLAAGRHGGEDLIAIGEPPFEDGQGEVGFISSVTQPFCGGCSRARISSDGMFYTCLFAQQGIDLRAPLRAGADDEALTQLVRGTWMNREDRYSEQRVVLRARSKGPKVEMNYIGG